ncbi:MAG: PAS domain S-box protein [Candidatus Cloacimonetes bacterium HGW-Cloacimonetes-1]|jgi:diguanylate cyclase (GGDEF)-like protein/PAS domain S-box-containing protein|nr:MAG: PAS domain S-box protein [Candidatus Cloacimonetes bacterium HGW-Cloacimonetes-1]
MPNLFFQDLYFKIFQSTQVAIAVTDLEGRYILVNDAWCRYMGYTIEQSKNLHINDITAVNDRVESDTNYQKLLAGEVNLLTKRKEYLRSDGKAFWADLYATPLLGTQGEISGVLGVFIDVSNEVKVNKRNADMQEVLENLNQELTATNILYSQQQAELQKAYEYMESLARIDELTGLYNRRVLKEKLEDEFLRANRIDQSCALAIADIDNFKFVNDTYGHDCGDMVLRELSQVFSDEIRSTDVVGRWGGEEFLFILPDTGLKGAKIVLERVLNSVRELRVDYDGTEIKVTISVGVNFYQRGVSKEAVLVDADKALYYGKTNGKDQVVFSDSCAFMESTALKQ